MRICYLRQSWSKGFRQTDKIKQNSFPQNVLQLVFSHCLLKKVEIRLLGVWPGTRHQSQAFWGFP